VGYRAMAKRRTQKSPHVAGSVVICGVILRT